MDDTPKCAQSPTGPSQISVRSLLVYILNVIDLGLSYAINFAENAAQLLSKLLGMLGFIQVHRNLDIHVDTLHHSDGTITGLERTTCTLCETRPPRRFCPALDKHICPPCCGEEREQTIDCPFDCEYLREARNHERMPDVDPKSIPNADVEVTEKFMEAQQPLAIVAGRLLLVAALETPGTVDFDLRETLASLTQTYRTADSGLIYESRPANSIAAAVADRFQQEIGQFREQIAQQSGVHSVRDKDLLGVLIYWQRMEWHHSNGRRKGRAFIESLFALMPAPEQDGNQPLG